MLNESDFEQRIPEQDSSEDDRAGAMLNAADVNFVVNEDESENKQQIEQGDSEDSAELNASVDIQS